LLDPAMLVFALVGVAWVLIALVVLAACRIAARSDLEDRGLPTQSPRRPSTCSTVRSKILTSSQSDQLATYK
jgi:hypothetical protein